MKELFKNLSHLMIHRHKVDESGFRGLMNEILGNLDLGWELGVVPNDHSIDQLSLSIIHNPLFIEQTEESIKLPIKGDDWIINLGIPPRDWQLFFEVQTDDDKVIGIEGREWKWVMEDSFNGFEILLMPPAHIANSLGEKDLLDCADILVMGEIGEMNYLTYISSVKLLQNANVSPLPLPMEKLRESFVIKFPDCQYSEWMKSSR